MVTVGLGTGDETCETEKKCIGNDLYSQHNQQLALFMTAVWKI